MPTYNFQGLSGCVVRRKIRLTGRMAAVYYVPDAKWLDQEKGLWANVCEDHQTRGYYRSLTMALGHLPTADWCPQCRAEIGGKVPVLEGQYDLDFRGKLYWAARKLVLGEETNIEQVADILQDRLLKLGSQDGAAIGADIAAALSRLDQDTQAKRQKIVAERMAETRQTWEIAIKAMAARLDAIRGQIAQVGSAATYEQLQEWVHALDAARQCLPLYGENYVWDGEGNCMGCLDIVSNRIVRDPLFADAGKVLHDISSLTGWLYNRMEPLAAGALERQQQDILPFADGREVR